jgi:hypothetical protein
MIGFFVFRRTALRSVAPVSDFWAASFLMVPKVVPMFPKRVPRFSGAASFSGAAFLAKMDPRWDPEGGETERDAGAPEATTLYFWSANIT